MTDKPDLAFETSTFDVAVTYANAKLLHDVLTVDYTRALEKKRTRGPRHPSSRFLDHRVAMLEGAMERCRGILNASSMGRPEVDDDPHFRYLITLQINQLYLAVNLLMTRLNSMRIAVERHNQDQPPATRDMWLALPTLSAKLLTCIAEAQQGFAFTVTEEAA